MKKTACLVASKRVARSDGQTQKADKDEEEENKLETDLVVPGQVDQFCSIKWHAI